MMMMMEQPEQHLEEDHVEQSEQHLEEDHKLMDDSPVGGSLMGDNSDIQSTAAYVDMEMPPITVVRTSNLNIDVNAVTKTFFQNWKKIMTPQSRAVIFLDIRPASDFHKSHLFSAINIPMGSKNITEAQCVKLLEDKTYDLLFKWIKYYQVIIYDEVSSGGEGNSLRCAISPELVTWSEKYPQQLCYQTNGEVMSPFRAFVQVFLRSFYLANLCVDLWTIKGGHTALMGSLINMMSQSPHITSMSEKRKGPTFFRRSSSSSSGSFMRSIIPSSFSGGGGGGDNAKQPGDIVNIETLSKLSSRDDDNDDDDEDVIGGDDFLHQSSSPSNDHQEGIWEVVKQRIHAGHVACFDSTMNSSSSSMNGSAAFHHDAAPALKFLITTNGSAYERKTNWIILHPSKTLDDLRDQLNQIFQAAQAGAVYVFHSHVCENMAYILSICYLMMRDQISLKAVLQEVSRSRPSKQGPFDQWKFLRERTHLLQRITLDEWDLILSFDQFTSFGFPQLRSACPPIAHFPSISIKELYIISQCSEHISPDLWTSLKTLGEGPL